MSLFEKDLDAALEQCDELLEQIAQAHKAADKAREEMLQIEEEWVKSIIRDKANPPIKGEITPGKLRWRGIKIVRPYLGLFDKKYDIEIWQRNELLGKVEIEFVMKFPL